MSVSVTGAHVGIVLILFIPSLGRGLLAELWILLACWGWIAGQP